MLAGPSRQSDRLRSRERKTDTEKLDTHLFNVILEF